MGMTIEGMTSMAITAIGRDSSIIPSIAVIIGGSMDSQAIRDFSIIAIMVLHCA
jgi:hypothetical protein